MLGNWFDKDFDRHGPAGPTAFWKVSDYIGDKDDESPEVDVDSGADDEDDDEDEEEEGDSGSEGMSD